LSVQSSSKPVTFHKSHGDDVVVENGGLAAARLDNTPCWSSGLLFSALPVKADQKIYVKLVVVSKACHDVISVGFTSRDPASCGSAEIEDAATSWTCALSKHYCTENAVICFYLTTAGRVRYGKVDGVEREALDKRVAMGGPVWAVFHIWSEPTTVRVLSVNEAMRTKDLRDEEVVYGVDCLETCGPTVVKDASVATCGQDENDGMCAICFVNGLEVVFVPCGHMCACSKCTRMVQNGDNLCPICRVRIGSVVRVYR
jgi:hypothetical protein